MRNISCNQIVLELRLNEFLLNSQEGVCNEKVIPLNNHKVAKETRTEFPWDQCSLRSHNGKHFPLKCKFSSQLTRCIDWAISMSSVCWRWGKARSRGQSSLFTKLIEYIRRYLIKSDSWWFSRLEAFFCNPNDLRLTKFFTMNFLFPMKFPRGWLAKQEYYCPCRLKLLFC